MVYGSDLEFGPLGALSSPAPSPVSSDRLQNWAGAALGACLGWALFMTVFQANAPRQHFTESQVGTSSIPTAAQRVGVLQGPPTHRRVYAAQPPSAFVVEDKRPAIVMAPSAPAPHVLVGMLAACSLAGWACFNFLARRRNEQAVAFMAVASKKKKEKSGKASKPKAPAVDINAMLRRAEKSYQELTKTFGGREVGDEIVLVEWVVAVRCKPGVKVEPLLSGWVPICSICVVANDMVHKKLRKETLVASLCREIGECLTLSSPALRTFPRTNLEYSVEPMDSWENFVFERKNSKDNAHYAELGLQAGADAKEVKTAYRKLAAQLHPDLHGHDPQVQEENMERMKRVQEAYKTLGGGYGENLDCWYAALGGRARTDFSGTLDLTGEKMGGAPMGLELPFEMGGFRTGVAQLESSIPMEFMSMNAMRHRITLEE